MQVRGDQVNSEQFAKKKSGGSVSVAAKWSQSLGAGKMISRRVKEVGSWPNLPPSNNAEDEN